MERREWFKIVGIGAMAGPAAAQRHEHAGTAAAAKAPPFFNAAQQATLDRLADIIIPADEQSPGAHDAGVVHYLDLLAAHSGPERQKQWLRGIEAVDGAARARFARGFSACARPQQVEIVTLMAAHEGSAENELDKFFTLLKAGTIDGYRFSEAGVKQYMGWAGNQLETKTWRGACTHPEHQS